MEERKKKHKKGKTDDRQDFPMRDEIRFGEVVEAPPKIAAFPKVLFFVSIFFACLALFSLVLIYVIFLGCKILMKGICSLLKAKKTTLGASHERLRLQAVEAYRKRKGWVSRPGIHLPTLTLEQSS